MLIMIRLNYEEVILFIEFLEADTKSKIGILSF
jgi:hypothetical protein